MAAVELEEAKLPWRGAALTHPPPSYPSGPNRPSSAHPSPGCGCPPGPCAPSGPSAARSAGSPPPPAAAGRCPHPGSAGSRPAPSSASPPPCRVRRWLLTVAPTASLTLCSARASANRKRGEKRWMARLVQQQKKKRKQLKKELPRWNWISQPLNAWVLSWHLPNKTVLWTQEKYRKTKQWDWHSRSV